MVTQFRTKRTLWYLSIEPLMNEIGDFYNFLYLCLSQFYLGIFLANRCEWMFWVRWCPDLDIVCVLHYALRKPAYIRINVAFSPLNVTWFDFYVGSQQLWIKLGSFDYLYFLYFSDRINEMTNHVGVRWFAACRRGSVPVKPIWNSYCMVAHQHHSFIVHHKGIIFYILSRAAFNDPRHSIWIIVCACVRSW